MQTSNHINNGNVKHSAEMQTDVHFEQQHYMF